MSSPQHNPYAKEPDKARENPEAGDAIEFEACRTNISDIPPEILYNIFSYLDWDTFNEALKCNRQFYAVSVAYSRFMPKTDNFRLKVTSEEDGSICALMFGHRVSRAFWFFKDIESRKVLDREEIVDLFDKKRIRSVFKFDEPSNILVQGNIEENVRNLVSFAASKVRFLQLELVNAPDHLFPFLLNLQRKYYSSNVDNAETRCKYYNVDVVTKGALKFPLLMQIDSVCLQVTCQELIGLNFDKIQRSPRFSTSDLMFKNQLHITFHNVMKMLDIYPHFTDMSLIGPSTLDARDIARIIKKCVDVFSSVKYSQSLDLPSPRDTKVYTDLLSLLRSKYGKPEEVSLGSPTIWCWNMAKCSLEITYYPGSVGTAVQLYIHVTPPAESEDETDDDSDFEFFMNLLGLDD